MATMSVVPAVTRVVRMTTMVHVSIVADGGAVLRMTPMVAMGHTLSGIVVPVPVPVPVIAVLVRRAVTDGCRRVVVVMRLFRVRVLSMITSVIVGFTCGEIRGELVSLIGLSDLVIHVIVGGQNSSSFQIDYVNHIPRGGIFGRCFCGS